MSAANFDVSPVSEWSWLEYLDILELAENVADDLIRANLTTCSRRKSATVDSGTFKPSSSCCAIA